MANFDKKAIFRQFIVIFLKNWDRGWIFLYFLHRIGWFTCSNIQKKLADFGDRAYHKINKRIEDRLRTKCGGLEDGKYGGLENGKYGGLEDGKCGGLDDGKRSGLDGNEAALRMGNAVTFLKRKKQRAQKCGQNSSKSSIGGDTSTLLYFAVPNAWLEFSIDGLDGNAAALTEMRRPWRKCGGLDGNAAALSEIRRPCREFGPRRECGPRPIFLENKNVLNSFSLELVDWIFCTSLSADFAWTKDSI